MYALIARYLRPAEEVDRHLDAHRAWIMENVEAGRFHATARQRPLIGGLILASAADEGELRSQIAHDPFVTAGVAEYDVLEFDVVRTVPELDYLKGLNRPE